jgi:hypothetical protein
LTPFKSFDITFHTIAVFNNLISNSAISCERI